MTVMTRDYKNNDNDIYKYKKIKILKITIKKLTVFLDLITNGDKR